MKLTNEQLQDIGAAFEKLTEAFPGYRADFWIKLNDIGAPGLSFTAYVQEGMGLPSYSRSATIPMKAVEGVIASAGTSEARKAQRIASLSETINKSNAELRALCVEATTEPDET